jgi:bifunctional non-homologous end joining protein LigD
MTRVALSNSDKPLWPSGFTKGQMVAYYERVAPVLLPHLVGRAVTLARFPDGVDGDGWYQMNCRGAPSWMHTATIIGRRGQTLRYCVIDDVASLLWVANLAAIELHPFLAPATTPDEPRALVLDLDPGAGAGVLDAARVATEVRAALERRGLSSLVKSSGKKGLHVYAPVAAGARFAETRALARAIARERTAARPDAVVAELDRAARQGRVLIDWRQNHAGLPTIAPYSLRAVPPSPAASAPLAWDEVEAALTTGRGDRLVFDPDTVLARVARIGDLFAAVA